MRRIATLALFLAFCAPCSVAWQSSANDVAAENAADQALNALGGTQRRLQLHDGVLTGTETIFAGDQQTIFPTTVKFRGDDAIRIETQHSGGTDARIVNKGWGIVITASGETAHLLPNNTIAERAEFVPLLSLLGEKGRPDLKLRASRRPAEVGKVKIDVFKSRPDLDEKQSTIFEKITERTFVIDEQTGLVISTAFLLTPEENVGEKHHVQMLYSDYRDVAGVMVPFNQIRMVNGIKESELIITSVTFNVGLSPQEFQVPPPPSAEDTIAGVQQ